MNAKQIVENYLQCLLSPETSLNTMRSLLADAFHFQGPLGEFFSAQDFIKMFERNPMDVAQVEISNMLVDGTKVSVLYSITSREKAIGTVSVTEWFEVKNGKIQSAISTFDATRLREVMAQI